MHGFRTHQTPIAVAGVDDLRIRALFDRQQFHDPHDHAARLGISSAAWPLFGLAWPSGIALAARLVRTDVVGRLARRTADARAARLAEVAP